MLPEVTKLLILQDKDQALVRLRKELKRLPLEEERARLKLAEATAAVAAAKSAMQENEVAIRHQEGLIKTRQETIGRLKFQQFETRKNEEYRALGNEVERYQKEVSGLEDTQLELMENAEGLKQAYADATTALEAGTKLLNAELAQLRERHTNVEAQVKAMEVERAAAAEKCEIGALESYDRIFKHRGDAAVVPLEGPICRGCNMKVSPATVNYAKAEKMLANCSNCARIVYWV